MSRIANGSDRELFDRSGDVPDLSGAMQNYFQHMVFTPLIKTVTGFQAVESKTAINFRGVMFPFNERLLALKPEGQRAWTWYLLYADPVLTLDVDDVLMWKNKQTRVMSRKDYSLYGFNEYHLVQDYTGSGP